MDGGLIILLVFVGLSILDAMARQRRRQMGPPPEEQESATAWPTEEPQEVNEPDVRGYDLSAASETHAPDLPSQARPRRHGGPRGPESPQRPPRRPARSMIPPELWDEVASLAKGAGQGIATTEPGSAPKADRNAEESTEIAWRPDDSAPPARPAGARPVAVPSKPVPVARSSKPASVDGDAGPFLTGRVGPEVALRQGTQLSVESTELSAIPSAERHSGGQGPLYTELFGAGDRASLRKAFVLKEVLGPPVAERPETD